MESGTIRTTPSTCRNITGRATCCETGRGYCVCKAALLCALGRAGGIPSRLGFATVRSHLASTNLIEYLGSDLFVWHGFTEFYLEGTWVKSTPAFNKELCQRHKVAPLEFDGREDSLFQEYDMENHRYMEYLTYHGTYADIPVDRILAAWHETYGRSGCRPGSMPSRRQAEGGWPILTRRTS